MKENILIFILGTISIGCVLITGIDKGKEQITKKLMNKEPIEINNGYHIYSSVRNLSKGNLK